jgi:FLVCR family MFS transporter 7
MLISGIVAAIATSPAFDRILTHHLGITVRILCPVIALAWLSLIWAGKESFTHPPLRVIDLICVYCSEAT